VAKKMRVVSRRCARLSCTRTVSTSAKASAKYCSPSCRTLACRQRKTSAQGENRSERNVNQAHGGVNLAEADARVDSTSRVNGNDAAPSLVTFPFTVLTDQLDGLQQALGDVKQSVSGTLVRQQELLATCDSRLASVERERDRLLVELRTYFEQQESRLRAEEELRHERDRLHLENQELRATLDAMKRQLAQPSGDAGSRNYPSERLSVEPRSAELAANHPSAKEVLSTMRGTLMRLLPAVPPDSTPIEQWPRDSPTDRDHWKHWLVPVVWPALSDIVNELHPTSPDEAARVRSELTPVTIVAAQLYLGLLLMRKPLPTADMLTGLVLSSLRAMPLAYAPSYVEQYTKHAGPLKLAAVIAIDSIHKLIQALIAELTSHKR
jgi:hypothetical protein